MEAAESCHLHRTHWLVGLIKSQSGGVVQLHNQCSSVLWLETGKAKWTKKCSEWKCLPYLGNGLTWDGKTHKYGSALDARHMHRWWEILVMNWNKINPTWAIILVMPVQGSTFAHFYFTLKRNAGEMELFLCNMIGCVKTCCHHCLFCRLIIRFLPLAKALKFHQCIKSLHSFSFMLPFCFPSVSSRNVAAHSANLVLPAK